MKEKAESSHDATSKRIWCCECECDVDARLTDGREIYPHRADLQDLPFWRCDQCLNFVGCHHKTANRTAPLGCIPTPELKVVRQKLHRLIDAIWQSGRIKRLDLYRMISAEVGWNYHTAKTRTVEEAQAVYQIVQKIAQMNTLPKNIKERKLKL